MNSTSQNCACWSLYFSLFSLFSLLFSLFFFPLQLLSPDPRGGEFGWRAQLHSSSIAAWLCMARASWIKMILFTKDNYQEVDLL